MYTRFIYVRVFEIIIVWVATLCSRWRHFMFIRDYVATPVAWILPTACHQSIVNWLTDWIMCIIHHLWRDRSFGTRRRINRSRSRTLGCRLSSGCRLFRRRHPWRTGIVPWIYMYMYWQPFQLPGLYSSWSIRIWFHYRGSTHICQIKN